MDVFDLLERATLSDQVDWRETEGLDHHVWGACPSFQATIGDCAAEFIVRPRKKTLMGMDSPVIAFRITQAGATQTLTEDPSVTPGEKADGFHLLVAYTRIRDAIKDRTLQSSLRRELAKMLYA